MTDPDTPVASPTYFGTIRQFFSAGEIACMAPQGIDLATYQGVKGHATDIYEQTKSGNMPLGSTRWSAARVQTFLTWIHAGCPEGVDPGPPPAPPTGGGGTATDPVVANPTYMGNIRYFFRPQDVACMKPMGVDLGTYAGVRANASAIYQKTKSGQMPAGGPAWSANRVQTFLNWIDAQFPMGAAVAHHAAAGGARFAAAAPAADTRLRKNLATLSQPELDLLATAFKGIMALDPKKAGDPVNPNSYFGLAALHGLPNAYCMHHVDGYNPWHRLYMKKFEDALRAVPGCADVTLPYWDITQPVPAALSTPPFANYTLPVDIGDAADFPAGYTTQRYDDATIEQNLAVAPSVASDITAALASSRWGAYAVGGFQGSIIAGHDDGHDSCGPTMAVQEVAAYDPIFWFFHCNWERLWQSWQVLDDATTVPGFVSTLDGDTDWLTLALDPYATTGEETIAWPAIAYDTLAGRNVTPTAGADGHAAGERAFRLAAPGKVSLRVKDIDRMAIPGSFVVWLKADGVPIARRAFFQPRAPQQCATCRQQALISLDFPLDHDLIAGKSLSVEIREAAPGKATAAVVPLAQAGNPTINVRLLLTEDDAPAPSSIDRTGS